LLIAGELPGLLGEIGEISLECRALEQVATPLQGFTQLPLRLGEALQRVLGTLGVKILQRLLQRGQALAQLRRKRAINLRADLFELALPRAVGHACGFGAAPERLDGSLEVLGLMQELVLCLRDPLRALRLLVGERLAVLLARALGARPLLGKVLGLSLQPPALRRRAVELSNDLVRSGSLRRADLAHGRQAENIFPGPPGLAPGCVIGGYGEVAHGVAGQEPATVEVERVGEDRAIRFLPGSGQRIAAGGVHRAEPADAPTLDRHARDAVVIPHIHHERDLQAERCHRVHPRKRDFHVGSAVLDDSDRQAHGVTRERCAARGLQHKRVSP
jgi:hypothetical protein